MYREELAEKSRFVKEFYEPLAKQINNAIKELVYVFDSITYEETLVVIYDSGYKKLINVTCDSLRAIVFDSIIKL